MKIIYVIYTVIIVMLLYQYMIYRVFGIPDSISQTWYLLNRGNNKHGVYFQFLLLVLGAFLWAMYPITTHEYSYLFILAGMGAVFVGMATKFKDKIEGIAHYGGAIILIFGTALAQYFVFGHTFPLSLLGIGLPILISNLPHRIYWYEVYAFAVLMVDFVRAFT